MNLRVMLINMLAFGIATGTLGFNGIYFTQGSFWVVLVCLMVVQINNSFLED